VASVLFCPVTFNLAETTRMIEVARALDPAHRAVFMGYEDDFVHLISDAGFEYHPCSPSWSAQERQRAIDFDQGKAIRSPFTRELVATRVAVERRMIRQHRAAAVVIGSNVTSMISARAEGVPLYYPVPFALTGPQVRQVRRFRFVAGEGPIADTADRIATAAFRWVYTRAPLAPRALSAVAHTNGVAPLRTVASLLEADVNLVTVMPWELDDFALPENYQRVGPIFAHLGGEVPGLVRALAAAPEPLVYLGLGSSARRELALAAATQLGALPINVLAPIRHYLEPGDVVPPNIHVTDLLPAHLLGGLVDAAVLHGGQGTVQTACATGIPFVGMGLQPEQTWNVRVCQRQGNAIAFSPKHVSKPAFLTAVRRILDDPAYRNAATRVREQYEREDGAAAAARIIEAALPGHN
jgi:UDP:flavonoid glycosyltransferase YjiC (YdhE family)